MGHAPSEETIKWVEGLGHNQGGSRVAHTIVQFAQICSEATELCTIIRRNQAFRRKDFESQVATTELMSIIRIAEAVDENGENWTNCKQNQQKWQIKRMTITLNQALEKHNAIFSLCSFDCYQRLVGRMHAEHVSSGTSCPSGYNIGVCRTFSSMWDRDRVIDELQFQVKRTYRSYDSRCKG